jgi:hypothetical protein
METVSGELVMPPAVAVTVVEPNELEALHTTKAESQTPAHTKPLGEIVARLLLAELKVKVVATGVPAEFTAEALIWDTSPATSESVVGISETEATVVLLLEEPPPQPASRAAPKKIIPIFPTQDRMPPPRPASRCGMSI